MFTLDDTIKLNKLMEQSPENHTLIHKLLESHQFTISKISHEIRNPLTLIYSTLQLIETQHPEVLTFTHWSDVVSDVRFTSQLLEELSCYNNSSRLNITRIHTTDFMNHLVLSYASGLVDTSVELTSEIQQTLPDIFGDSIKLRELFLNLLRNAADAVSHRGNIYLSASQENDSLVVRISDTGCGIDPSRIDDIFTPFVTFKHNGTGLGLAIAKTVAEAHKGSIEVSSLPGQGTTFTVVLPVQKDCQEKS